MQNSTSSPNADKSSSPKIWRLFGAGLLALAALTTIIALFYLEEDWRGKSDWQAYEAQAAARGVIFDYQKFTPPTVPDEQNFAMTPFLAPLLNLNGRPFNDSPYRDKAGVERAQKFAADIVSAVDKTSPMRVSGQTFDLVKFATELEKKSKSSLGIAPDATRENAAVAVLQYVEQFNPVLNELRAASHLPYARFNIHYEDEDPAGILLPHLAIVKKVSLVFFVRASAELAVKNPDAAFDDVKMEIYLADSIREEPMLISHLVRLAVLRYADQAIWEGLASHQWSETQLRDFQTHLENYALLKESKRGFDGERAAFGTKLFDLMRTRPGYIRNITEDHTPDQAALAYAPSGWLYFEEISYHRYFDDRLLVGFDPDSSRVYPKKIEASALSKDSIFNSRSDNLGFNNPGPSSFSRLIHHTVLRDTVASSLTPIVLKSALGQTGMDEANVACGVERYRLANGKPPENLDSLVPKFLAAIPKDVCSENPLIYHVKDGQTYQLYSVGWNETDDGGTPGLDGSGTSPQPNPKTGDWVWPEYPVN